MKTIKSRAYKDRLKGHKDTILILFSPDGPEGHIIVSGSADGVVRAWDLKGRSTKFKLQLERPTGKQEITNYSFQNSLIFVGYSDGGLASYSLEDAQLTGLYQGHTAAITAIKPEKRIVTASQDCTVRI